MNMNHFDEITCCDYLDDTLPPSERAACDRHLAECGACRAMLEEAREGHSGLHGLELRQGPDLTPKIMAAVRKLPIPSPATSGEAGETASGTPWLGWLSVLTAAALAVVLYLAPHRIAAPPTTPATSVPLSVSSAHQGEALPLKVAAAEGDWRASVQPVEGLYQSPVRFTTGPDGHLTLSGNPGEWIELLPGSQISIEGTAIRVEAGSIRGALAAGTSGQSRLLSAGPATTRIQAATFRLCLASGVCTIDLTAGQMTFDTVASAAPTVVTAGTRIRAGDRLLTEPLPEPDASAVCATATPPLPASPGVTIDRPADTAHPVVRPATGPAAIGQASQPAEVASPVAVTDDPLSTLLEHQPGSN
ncbi:MAG TPA: zf-HC2 domain-containing protein [Candidatus Ozemobacteraceae bacterium]|nr:zf-HC2 domain-containing protein [Candidatus Ozemobacteraceae bacterium]